ncbi:Cadherin-17 Intestinal peptide-associated transporter HPT-1 [Collichthys lucidus]|uniref:Cadherin-17 Intestinal peptide-associated transporter HPT-1 n=1 Tax=Collichthys lucidus TaxID=240159 RepID=A0A4U5V2Q8_COLLU|nr:Cadherin-17 Intestinal peptide-associated transporter HPT-1 [Collichthys lucidus]
MLSSVRRHSLRLQSELHRWSICDPGSHLLPDSFLTRVPACISRSKSCNSSAGESDGSRGSWSSSDSIISTDSAGDAAEPGSPYRVVLLGASGVGKTAFASIFAGAADSMDSDDCELCGDEVCEKEIEVDGEPAILTVLDTWDAETDNEWAQERYMQTGDAYLLLYSVTDRSSFVRASELRITLRRFRPAQHTPIILVGNKCDLVRRREVSVSEGRACAAVFDCKFIETSAAMQHNVWEAFHGIVRQLRLRRDSKEANKRRRHIHCSTRRESLPMKAKRFLDKVVAKNNPNDEVVEGPISVTIHVLDVNNNAPTFDKNIYTAVVREYSPAGAPFIRVSASDRDDPQTPNAHLSFSLVSQIPNKNNILLFQINSETGEISTTEEGRQMLKAREGIHYGKGEDRSIEALKTKFNDYCPVQNIPYEENPFFTCMERAELRRRNVDPLEDPDYTLIVRVQDMGGVSETALSGNARVQIVVQQNLWVNPGPIIVQENLRETYPVVIAKYILVVLAQDNYGKEVDPPMEIQVLVEDVNDNAPICEEEESVFELQEGEPVGSLVGQVVAHDADDEGTLNSQLTYSFQDPDSLASVFSIEPASGRIQALRSLQRREKQMYNFNVKVSDPVFTTECKVVIKVIDVNNELPLFAKTEYGDVSLAEDTPLGHTVLTIKATDADDPDSGSSRIEFHITAGNNDGVFTVETDGKGTGHVVIAKPLDFESSSNYKLQIDARNPEPLMKGLEYGSESTAFVSVSLTDIDEAPEFSVDIMEVTVPENTTKGSVLLTMEAKDPEGKEIGYKLDGDTQGWLEIDAATGEIKTKEKLDRETVEAFKVTVTAFEKENPEKSSEREVTVRLLDVNDNFPVLTEKQAFICVKKPEPVIITAQDPDSEPFSQPFTFSMGTKKSSNWDLQSIDATSAQLTLKRKPTEDRTFSLSITVKDNAGVGTQHSFEAIVFIIVIKRVKKGDKKKVQSDEEERNMM